MISPKLLKTPAILCLTALIGILATGCNSVGKQGEEVERHIGGIPAVAQSPIAIAPAGVVSELAYSAMEVLQTKSDHWFIAGLTPSGEKNILELSPYSESGLKPTQKIQLPKACNTLGQSNKEIIVGCGQEIKGFNVQAQEVFSFSVEDFVVALARVSDSEIAVKTENSKTLDFYSAQGEKKASTKYGGDNIDALLPVSSKTGGNHVITVNNDQSALTDETVSDHKVTGSLRVGQGIGTAQGSDQGIIIASDTVQNQLLLFTATQIIRHELSGPTSASPFAVAWDAEHQLAWVSTTGDNKVTGYAVQTGKPVVHVQFDTISNVREMKVIPRKGLVLSDTSSEIQIIPFALLSAASV